MISRNKRKKQGIFALKIHLPHILITKFVLTNSGAIEFSW